MNNKYEYELIPQGGTLYAVYGNYFQLDLGAITPEALSDYDKRAVEALQFVQAQEALMLTGEVLIGEDWYAWAFIPKYPDENSHPRLMRARI